MRDGGGQIVVEVAFINNLILTDVICEMFVRACCCATIAKAKSYVHDKLPCAKFEQEEATWKTTFFWGGRQKFE